MTCGGPVADAVERAAVEALLQLPNVSAGIDTRTPGFRVRGPAPPSIASSWTPELAGSRRGASAAACCWNPVEITIETDHEIGDEAD